MRWTCSVLLGVALALGGCKSEPEAPPRAAEPDAAVIDARVVDAQVVDAQVVDATTDALVLTGETTILKLNIPKPASGKPSGAPPPKNPAPGRQVSIMGTIRKHQNEVVDCYARVAENKPDVAGQLTVSWTLGGNGKPTMTNIARDTLGDPAVAACVKQKAMKWQFPPPSGGTSVVKYTWTLKMQ